MAPATPARFRSRESAEPPPVPPELPSEGLEPEFVQEPLGEKLEELQHHKIFDAREAEDFGHQVGVLQHQGRARALSEAENMALIASLRRDLEQMKREDEPPKVVEKMSKLQALRERKAVPHPYDVLPERHSSFLRTEGIEPDVWQNLQQISTNKSLQRRAIRRNTNRTELVSDLHRVVQESRDKRRKRTQKPVPEPKRAAAAPKQQARRPSAHQFALGYAER